MPGGKIVPSNLKLGDDKMPSQLPPFSLRIPEELLDKIRFIAQKNLRSANKEIEFALIKYVSEYEKQHGEIKVE